MTLMAGHCNFTEVDGNARVFALCELKGSTTLVPVSMPGETSVRGIRSSDEGRRLLVQVGRLHRTLTRVYIGMSVPRNHDLMDVQLALRLTFDAGNHTDLPLARRGVRGNRYAIMAIMTVSGIEWNIGRMQPAELFTDRITLSELHSVPSWWSSRA
jgi:hypothetical protein